MVLISAKNGDLAGVKKAISGGADINAISNALLQASFEGHYEIAKLLIEKGANVNITDDRQGITVLMYAVAGRNIEIIKLLLKHGANVNDKNNEGKTALDIAMAFSSPNRTEIIRILKAAGARIGRGN